MRNCPDRPSRRRRPRLAVPGLGPRFGQLIRLRFGPRAPLTDDLFAAISAENPELRMERTAQGDLEIMAPAGGEGSNRNSDSDVSVRAMGRERRPGARRLLRLLGRVRPPQRRDPQPRRLLGRHCPLGGAHHGGTQEIRAPLSRLRRRTPIRERPAGQAPQEDGGIPEPRAPASAG